MGDVRVERTDSVIAMPTGLDRVVATLGGTTLERSGTGSVFMLSAERRGDGADVTITRRALDGTTQRFVRLEPVECDEGTALVMRPEVVGLDWDAKVRDSFLGKLEHAARIGGADYLRMHSRDAPEFGVHMAQRGWDFLPGYDEADLVDGDGFDGCPALTALDATLAAGGTPPLGLHVHQYLSLVERVINTAKEITGCEPGVADELFGDLAVLWGPRAFAAAISANPSATNILRDVSADGTSQPTATLYTLPHLREFANHSPDAFMVFHMIRRSMSPSEWLSVQAPEIGEDDAPLDFGSAWIGAVPWNGELTL